MSESHPNCICENWDRIPPKYLMGEMDGFTINHSTQPVVFGHLIVMLKKHPKKGVQYLTQIDESEFKKCFKIVYKISNNLPEIIRNITGLKVEKIYLASFNDSDDWHPHIYIVPRTQNIIPDRRGQELFDMPRPFLIPIRDLEDLRKQLKEKIPEISDFTEP